MIAVTLFYPRKLRHVPPPLPPDGGGFFYLKRVRDGAILLKRDRTYRQFDSEGQARDYAAAFVREPVAVRFMPKLRTH